MKEVEEKPTTGQFVELWIHDGEVFSQTMRWNGIVLETYSSYHDQWNEDDTDGCLMDGTRFFIQPNAAH